MNCVICSSTLNGRQKKYCSRPCAIRSNFLANVADGKWRANRPKYKQSQSDYGRRRRLGLTGLPTVPCAACGADTGKVAASEPGRRRVCSTMCRTYLRYGRWPCSAVKPPVRRSPPKPLVIAWVPDRRSCAWCDATFTAGSPTSAYCTDNCKARASRMRRAGREAATYGEWRWSDFMRIARKFAYCCAYCGEKPDRLDPDHVVALSRGGHNVIANLLPTCMPCNSDKRQLTLDEWAGDRERRQLPPRATAWSDADQRYWHLTCLTPTAA